MSYVDGSISWRFPLVVPIILGIIVQSFIFSLPESPRYESRVSTCLPHLADPAFSWLVKKGRSAEAVEIMSILYDVDRSDAELQSEIRDIELSLEINKDVSLMSMFKMGPQRIFHRVVLAGIIQMYLQMSGTNVSRSRRYLFPPDDDADCVRSWYTTAPLCSRLS